MMSNTTTQFTVPAVAKAVAAAIPDRDLVIRGERRYSYAQLIERSNRLAGYLHSRGLGCHTERSGLAGHEVGQDLLGIYAYNGNEFVEALLGTFQARVAPFNVNYRYVKNELQYLLADAGATALIYHAAFAPRVAEILPDLPRLRVLIQIADDSGNDLLYGAVDYETIVASSSPEPPPVRHSPDDLYVLYTGGTTGMPKGVLWRQNDIFVSSMGGRSFGTDDALASYDELAERAEKAAGFASVLLIAPFMHGAAQWAAFQIMTMGGWVAIPDDVESIRADQILALAERERVMSIPVVGDAIARPLVDEVERGRYDLSGLVSISNGGAPLTPAVRNRIVAAL